MEPCERTVHLGGRDITYTLERKRVKNINLRIHRDGTVCASAGRKVTAEQVDRFVLEKEDFVLKALERFAAQEALRPAPLELVTGEHIWLLGEELPLTVVPGRPGGVVRTGEGLTLTAPDPENFDQKLHILGKFWDGLCRQVYAEALDRLLPRLGERYQGPGPSLQLRNTTSRWGSCTAARASIRMNKRLLQAPQSCVDYVMMHELCHLVYQDHSARFYGLLDELMPGWQAQRAMLKENTARWI